MFTGVIVLVTIQRINNTTTFQVGALKSCDGYLNRLVEKGERSVQN